MELFRANIVFGSQGAIAQRTLKTLCRWWRYVGFLVGAILFQSRFAIAFEVISLRNWWRSSLVFDTDANYSWL
jgi:hypothetical protein